MASSSSYSLWILRFEPVEQGVLVEGSRCSTGTAVTLDIGDGVGVLHYLNEPHFVPSGQAAIWDHPVSVRQNQHYEVGCPEDILQNCLSLL